MDTRTSGMGAGKMLSRHTLAVWMLVFGISLVSRARDWSLELYRVPALVVVAWRRRSRQICPK